MMKVMIRDVTIRSNRDLIQFLKLCSQYDGNVLFLQNEMEDQLCI